MNRDKYYRHSGKFKFISLIPIFLICLIYAVIGGFLYAWITWVNPLFFINFFATIFYGVIAATIANILLMFLKVRNWIIYKIVGLFSGVIIFYFQWVFWVNIWTNKYLDGSGIDEISAYEWSTNPTMLYLTIGEINDVHGWSISRRGRGGLPLSGFFVDLVWFIEGLIIIGYPLISIGIRQPFCEKTNQWPDKVALPLNFNYIDNKQELKSALEKGDASVFKQFKLESHKSNHSKIYLYVCPDIKNQFVSIENTKVTYDEDGKMETTNDMIIENVRVESNVINKLLYASERIASVILKKV